MSNTWIMPAALAAVVTMSLWLSGVTANPKMLLGALSWYAPLIVRVLVSISVMRPS